MTLRKPKICGSCGSSNITVKNLIGMEFAWRDYVKVTLKRDFFAPVCKSCGEVFLAVGSGKKMDKLLEESLEDDQNS